MSEQNQQTYILGFVPSRRYMGLAVLNGTTLCHYSVKSLKQYKSDSEKMTVAYKTIREIFHSYSLKAIIYLKPCPQAQTKFNEQLIMHLNELVKYRYSPLYSLSLEEVKKLLSTGPEIKTQRQLAEKISSIYPELVRCKPDTSSQVIREHEKYYRPMFAAVGLALSYLKLIDDEKNKSAENSNTQCS